MIDIHSHVLPEVDDGARSVEESLQMLRDSYNQGVEACVATPHCTVHNNDSINDFCKKREEGFLRLKPYLDESCPRIILGGEIYLDNDLSRYEDIKKLCIGDTDFMLVEFPFRKQSKQIADWIYSLTIMGITPIIAHIDRYPNWKKLMEELSELNVIYQLNATIFLSMGTRHIAKKILEKNEIFIVSSDMHNTDVRCSYMEKAYMRAEKMYPLDVDELFGENAKKILGI